MKFRNVETNKTHNLAYGQAFTLSPELELISLVLTSFLADTFYSKQQEQIDRLVQLVHTIQDKMFIGQVAIYARNVFGMRSITHVLIGELVSSVKSEPWLKHVIVHAIRRPDDILEIVAYYLQKHQNLGYKKGLSAALRKGLALALQKFDAYQLAKYRAENSNIKMVDVLNLVHPHPGTKIAGEDGHDEHVYAKLIKGTLKSTDTWEARLSKAGQEETGADLDDAKAEIWADLLQTKKLGYFALLRNLRAIITTAPECAEQALAQLVDEKAIKKSLVLPFRFLTAVKEIQKIPGELAQQTIQALNKATEIALSNVPVFEGSTLIALDISGSMNGKPIEIGSLFAACIAKVNASADVLTFHETAEYVTVNRADSLLTLTQLLSKVSYGGTDFRVIFNVDKAYDRIIILSDMQAWIGHNTPEKEFDAYCKRVGIRPFIHTFDLAGYGNSQFCQDGVFSYAGFSEKVLDIMRVIEIEPHVLIDTIKAQKID